MELRLFMLAWLGPSSLKEKQSYGAYRCDGSLAYGPTDLNIAKITKDFQGLV